MSLEWYSIEDSTVSVEQQRLVTALAESTRVVALMGAGASVAAGLDDFKKHGSIFQKLGGRSVLSEGVFRSPEMLRRHHTLVQYICNIAALAQPTKFHKMFDGLAKRGRLLQLFTQNIDGLETRLPDLYTDRPLRTEPGTRPNTVELHGNANFMYCTQCVDKVWSIRLSLFHDDRPPTCPECQNRIDKEARDNNKRSSRTPGVLRPWLLLYDHLDGGLQEMRIVSVVNEVINAKPDLFIVAGTRLDVPGALLLVQKISAVVKAHDGVVVWVNMEEPKGPTRECFNIWVKGTCEQFAELAGYR